MIESKREGDRGRERGREEDNLRDSVRERKSVCGIENMRGREGGERRELGQ